MSQQTAPDRLRVLVDAGIALSSELSLDALLQQLVETAAQLTGARYAALGVIDQSGTGLERFLTTGIDAETHAAIGDLPRGRGILGVLIREAKPLRLDKLGDDPRAVGFPANHPPMQSFLGVPILLRGVAYGNLYLTEKEGGRSFTDEDEELTQLLAAQAAVAIENTRLYETSNRWLRHLESLSEIGDALAGELELDPLLGLVARRLRTLIGARLVLVALPETGRDRLRIAAADGEGSDAYGLVDVELELAGSKTGRVLERGRSERVDSVLDDPEMDQQVARRMGVRSALYVPLVADGRPIGVVVAHDKLGATSSFTDEDLRLTESLAARAATAVALSQRVSRDAVRRVVEAQELERARLARELHDETGQALTSILLGLKSLEGRDADRPAVDELRELVVSTLQSVRRLAVELRPAALDDFGLVPAVERLRDIVEEQSRISVDVESELGDGRLPAEAETALYRIAQEAFTNVVKHADASRVTLRLSRRDDAVMLVVQDDGTGFDPALVRDGSLGLVGMRERVALLGGRLTIESSEGAGTMLTAEVPLR
jgi:two-component system, NarL family, sensor histidine kinase DevS